MSITKKISIVLLLLCFVLPPIRAFSFIGTVNINSASEKDLQQLPFIGKRRAQSIIAYRQKHGPFRQFEELLKVENIGRKSFDAIKPYLILYQDESKSIHSTSVNARKKLTLKGGDILLLPNKLYYDTLVEFIRSADNSIFIAMFLFKTTPSPKNRPKLLVEELIRARKRGVMVTVLLEKSDYNDSVNKENRSVAQKLERNRIKVKFDSPKTTTHAKLVIIDKRFSFIGSHNLTHSALAYNHELSLLIDNHNVASELLNYLDTIH